MDTENIKPNDKAWIDNASYETLLSKWRFAPVGDPLLQGETGQYYSQAMKTAKAKITDAETVRASKNIGWG